MNLKTVFETDDAATEINVTVKAKEYDENVKHLLKEIERISNNNNEIVAKKDNDIYLLKAEDITMAYAIGGAVYIKAKKEEYKVDYRLYELETFFANVLFIRISHSVIVNKMHIKCFAANIIGGLIVKLDDGTEEYVSQRREKEIMKMLRRKKNEKQI